MRLKHITFTGVDEKTDIERLISIQQKYPIAEFGVLTSYHWQENGNRYPNPEIIERLRRLNLSLHLCGSVAHDAAVKEWDKVDDLVHGGLHLFKRVQLNVSARKDNPEYCWIPIVFGQELIIQQSGDITLYEETLKHWSHPPFPHRDTISMLLDASGGRGIDTRLKVFSTNGKVGYAGGFNPDNVADKLTFLLENVKRGEFWIDMESGVRTDDWFDLNKVEMVLRICNEIIKSMVV